MGIQALRGSSTAYRCGDGRIAVLFDNSLAASADNGTATVSMAAPTDGSHWVIEGWGVAFSAAPAAAKSVTVTVNGNAVTYLTPAAAGWQEAPFRGSRIVCPANSAASVALAASGAGGTIGYVWVLAFKEKPAGEG